MKNIIGLLSPILFMVGVFFILLNPTNLQVIITGMVMIAISMLTLAYSIIFREKKTIIIHHKVAPKRKR